MVYYQCALDAHLNLVGEIDAVHLLQKAVDEMLAGLLALGDDVDAGILLQLYRQHGGVALGARQFVACFPWTMTHKAQGFTLDAYPNVKRWYAEVRARPQVQAGLAIGKFVMEPFDEEARRNMFGARAKEMRS
jgi:hypothetical protein